MVATKASAPSDGRRQILNAATRLIAAHGFDGTTLQDVADVVGVSKPAILHHFASKEILRQAVIDELLAHWTDTLPRLLLAATASTDRFDAVFGELWRFFTDDADRARLVLRELLDRPEAMRALLVGTVRPWLGAVARYIRAGQESGRHFAEADAEAYVVHILQLVVGAASAADVTLALLDGEARARYDRELARIAKASLFRNDVPPRSKPRTRSTPRA